MGHTEYELAYELPQHIHHEHMRTNLTTEKLQPDVLNATEKHTQYGIFSNNLQDFSKRPTSISASPTIAKV
jgi:hypothetical protein